MKKLKKIVEKIVESPFMSLSVAIVVAASIFLVLAVIIMSFKSSSKSVSEDRPYRTELTHSVTEGYLRYYTVKDNETGDEYAVFLNAGGGIYALKLD